MFRHLYLSWSFGVNFQEFAAVKWLFGPCALTSVQLNYTLESVANLGNDLSVFVPPVQNLPYLDQSMICAPLVHEIE